MSVMQLGSTAFCATTWIVVVSSCGTVQDTSPPRSTGDVQVVSGPTDCGGQSCYEVRITCPEVALPARAILQVAPAREAADNRIVVFTTGGLGRDLYEDVERGAEVLESARTAGVRTIQLQWIDSWLVASEGSEEGHARLACSQPQLRSGRTNIWPHPVQAKPFALRVIPAALLRSATC